MTENYIEKEIDTIISQILENYNDFNYVELWEICSDFVSEIPAKIKDTTKIKRLKRYLDKDFWINLDEQENTNTQETWKYSLSNIPKYLFEWKSKFHDNLVNIKNLNANIWLTNLFENLNFVVNKTDKIALIWKNGAGKTTLLKLIIWKEIPEIEMDGKIELAPNLKIGYLSQDLFWINKKNTLEQEMMQVFPEITQKIKKLDKLKENQEKNFKEIEKLNKEIIEEDGFKKYDLQKNILKYFWFTEAQMKQNVLSFSWWEQTKIQIAKFLIQQVDLLILDEPTNHLDIEWIIFLERFCQNWKKALITISHDKRFIDNASEKIAEIYHHKIFIYNWKFADYKAQKQAMYEKQLKDYNVQQKFLKEEYDYINRFRANSAKATSVQSRIKKLEKMEIIKKPENEINPNFIKIKTLKKLPEVIIKLQQLKAGYNEVLVELPEEIKINKKDRIWIIWANGTWKTTLLKTILWELKPIFGKSIINKNIKIGSFSQILDDLDPDKSILQELAPNPNEQQKIRNMLWWLLIQWNKVEQKIKSISGWERAKIWLVKMLLQTPDIIIMDEPTNHLDLQSKEVIKELLVSFNGPSIIVSHDRDLLENVSNKIWIIKNKKLDIYDDVEKWISKLFC